jgi:hypothetical protein
MPALASLGDRTAVNTNRIVSSYEALPKEDKASVAAVAVVGIFMWKTLPL